MDKWLWAARFFKTRALASKSCDLGRVASNGTTAKSSREVRVADLLVIKNEAGEFEVSVLLLSEIRGPAAVAQTSTFALNNATLPYLVSLATKGLKQACHDSQAILEGVNTYEGHIV